MSEKLTICCFWIAGLIEAAEEGLKRAPMLAAKMPDIISNDLWAFVPMGFLVIGAGAWAINRFRVRPKALDQIADKSKDVHGIEFFESREKLDRRPLDNQLATATTIYAILMVGRKIREYNLRNLRHIRKVILPDPYLKSALDYAKTVGNEAHFPTYIIESTKFFQDNGIEVKWYPHVIFNSILIGDASEANGWVHLETNLPYANSNLRHSLTIYRKSYGRLVSSFEDIFNLMWREARIPGPLSFVSINRIIMHVASKISEPKTDKYYPDARLQIRQKAIDGMLSLYGNRSEPTPIKVDGTSWNLARVPIPATYWEKADITVMATEPVSENRFVPHTMPTKTSSDIYVTDFEEKYANLQGHWAEVIEIWP